MQTFRYIVENVAIFNGTINLIHEKVQAGKDQEKAQSEKETHSKNRGGKNQTNNQVLIP